MIKAFKIYVILSVVGFMFRLFWDLNHSYNWIVDADLFYGIGIGLLFIGCAIEIDSRQSKGWQKIFTRFWLFTAISNLCDEVLFDPYDVSWQEWVVALVVLISVYLYERKKEIK